MSKDNRVEIFVPRSIYPNDQDYFISVNGKNYLLPRGKTHKVPPEVAAEFHRSQKAIDAWYNMAASRQNSGEPEQNSKRGY